MRVACLRVSNLCDEKRVDAVLRDGVLLKPDARGNLVASGFDTTSTDIATATAVRADMTNAKMSNAFVVQNDLSDTVMRNVRLYRPDLNDRKSDVEGKTVAGSVGLGGPPIINTTNTQTT